MATTPTTMLTEPLSHDCAPADANAVTKQRRPKFKLLLMHHIMDNYCDTVDSSPFTTIPYTVGYCEILFTVVSMVGRAYAVAMNILLAYDYYKSGNDEYGYWTTICLVASLIVTSSILANMCLQDGKLAVGFWKASWILFSEMVISYSFRYARVLFYSVKCKMAERKGQKEEQIKYHKKTIREESDVAFVRIFECFLETSPLKILLISIILRQQYDMHTVQIITLFLYFTGMAWCMAVYHRSSRCAQSDKYDIKCQGFVLQLCWHFCTSVARTICLALVASVLPVWTIAACCFHALLSGLLTYAVDRPEFAETALSNLLFMLVLGFVYLFTYVPVKDGPTLRKYCIYYVLCFAEILLCIYIFAAAKENYGRLKAGDFALSVLCGVPVLFYLAGIAFMAIYYTYYHPHITARKSKRLTNAIHANIPNEK